MKHLEITRLLLDSAEQGSELQVKFFITKGADVNAKDKDGVAALHYAAGRGELSMMKVLIKNGANVNIKNNYIGNTPLHYAVGKGNIEIFKCLINNNANINVKNKNGSTILHQTSDNDKEHIELGKFLIVNGMNVNAKSNVGATPLHHAAYNGHQKLAKLFIENGANVNAKVASSLYGINAVTPLDFAEAANEAHELFGIDSKAAKRKIAGFLVKHGGTTG
jgi:ankyrin repeat protein